MTSKDSFNGRNSMVRTKSLFTDSFKMGASLLQGMTSSNKSIKHLTLDNIKLTQKQYQQKQICSICFVGFNKILRRHHCRLCSRSCCGDCSSSTINKQRCCDICIYHYIQPQKALIKQGILERIKINALEYIGGRALIDEKTKELQMQMPNQQEREVQKNQAKIRIAKLEAQLEDKRKIKLRLQQEIEQIKNK